MVLLLFVFAGGATIRNVSAESDRELSGDIPTQTADKIAARIALIRERLEDLAQDQAVIKLFAEVDAAGLESKAEEMQSDFESALKLRFLLPGEYAVDSKALPPLGYASLDLLRRAEESEAPVDVEAHSIRNDGAHIAFASRVTDVNNKLVGLLYLSVALEAIESVIPNLNNSDAYIEIRQGSGNTELALIQSDDDKLRTGSSVVVEIKGSKWNVASWDGLSSAEASGAIGKRGLEEESSVMRLIVIVLLVFVAGAGGFAFYSRKLTFFRLNSGGKGLNDGTKVVYEGAVKAIMEGAYPGLENLIPDLPESDKKISSGTVSPGMDRGDVTAIFNPSDIRAGKFEQVSRQDNVTQSTEADVPQEKVIVPEKMSNEISGQDSIAETDIVQPK